MNFIVLDLEWNQPLSYNSTAYKNAGGKLIFEMIQIGAVKMDERLEVVDTFSQLIRPSCYLKLHPRIRRITQIEQGALDEAPVFSDALKNFENWCGEDYALITWGCDDISVFHQNLTFFGCENHLGTIYDAQRLFGEVIGNAKERKGLKGAMEYYEISPNEDRAFHNAVNDAYYTALVFAKLPEPQKVLNHPLTPKELVHTDRRKRSAALSMHKASKSVPEMLKSIPATLPNCPICGKKQPLKTDYLKIDEKNYTALALCADHGLMTSKLRFYKDEAGKRMMERAVALTEEQNKAYISTKILQWQNKIAAQASQLDK